MAVATMQVLHQLLKHDFQIKVTRINVQIELSLDDIDALRLIRIFR